MSDFYKTISFLVMFLCYISLFHSLPKSSTNHSNCPFIQLTRSSAVKFKTDRSDNIAHPAHITLKQQQQQIVKDYFQSDGSGCLNHHHRHQSPLLFACQSVEVGQGATTAAVNCQRLERIFNKWQITLGDRLLYENGTKSRLRSTNRWYIIMVMPLMHENFVGRNLSKLEGFIKLPLMKSLNFVELSRKK